MTDEKWEELVDIAKKNFQEVEVLNEELIMPTPDGPLAQGTQDVLIFKNPRGKFKVVRENRPAVLEKKMHYSHRQGDTAQTEYKLSDTEFSHRLRVYQDDLGDWEEVDMRDLGLA